MIAVGARVRMPDGRTGVVTGRYYRQTRTPGVPCPSENCDVRVDGTTLDGRPFYRVCRDDELVVIDG